MALTCVAIAASDSGSAAMHHFLNQNKFMKLLGSYRSVAEAVAHMDLSNVNYVMADAASASAGLTYLLNIVADKPRFLIFAEERVFFLENIEGDFSEFSATHLGNRIPHEEQMVLTDPKPIFFRAEQAIQGLAPHELWYAEAQKDYVVLHSSQGDFRVLTSIKNVEQKLVDYNFFRVHRSYLVQVGEIKRIEGDQILLRSSDDRVAIGPSFKSKLIAHLNII